jgi:hypothetical protein
MLMSSNKDKMAATIIAGMGNKEDKQAPEQEGAEQDDSVGMESAAEELISAIESKSPKAVVAALKACMDMYEQSEPEEASEAPEQA